MLRPTYKPTVFISHSTRAGDTREAGFLDRLYRKLIQARNVDGTDAFEVWLDKEDRSIGDEWRARLHQWITSCDAAIVLLSEAATYSNFVRHEVTLLTQRRLFHPNGFMLLPVRFPEVTDQTLKDRMGPQHIAEVQMRGLTETNEDEVLDELLLHLGLLSQRIPKHKIEQKLFRIFCSSLADEALKIIGDALALGAVLAGAQIDRAQMVVRLLLEAETDPNDVRFSRLRTLLEGVCLEKIDQGHRSQLLDLIFPFCWVNSEAASKLPEVAARAPRTRSVAWAREWSLSERMYLVRGYCHTGACAIDVSNLDGGVGSLDGDDGYLGHILSCLCQGLLYHRPKGSYADTKRKLLKEVEKREQEGEPVFLIIPFDAVDKDRAEMILNEFPNITLFFYSETLTPEALADFEFPNTEFLAPMLDPEAESEAYMQYGRLLKLIGEPLDRLNDPQRLAL